MGSLFGEIAEKRLSMKWQIITDEYGVDFCLSHKETHTVIFPFSSVYKRIESRESGFFGALFQIVRAKIEENLA